MLYSNRVIVRMLAAAALTVLTVSFIPELAQAADHREEARSVTVQYHRADLNSPEGIAIFYRSIRAAADNVCSPLESALLERRFLWDECFNRAVANAVNAVHNQKLSAYHAQRIRGWRQPRNDAPSSVAAR